MLGVDGPDGADALERAVSATQRGASLIDQLMTFAHKHDGAITLQPLRIDDSIREAEGRSRLSWALESGSRSRRPRPRGW